MCKSFQIIIATIHEPVSFVVEASIWSICHTGIDRDTFSEIIEFGVVHIDGDIDSLRSASTTQDAFKVINLALQCGKIRIFDTAFARACPLTNAFLTTSYATLEEHGKRRHRKERAHHSVMFEIDDLERVLCRRCRTKAVDVSVDMNDAELNDLAERIAIDACIADAPDASFDYRGDWLANRNSGDDLKRLAQRENMA